MTSKEAHTLVDIYRPQVNFSLHLDHGENATLIQECVSAGYDSVHVDLKLEPPDELIEKVRLLTIYCHSHNVAVEAGIGEISGSSTLIQKGKNRNIITDPDYAYYFATKTGIDFLLVSIGETNGMSDRESLDFPLLTKIHQKIPLPLVLHGGSGIAPDDLKKAINLGVRKINFNTELRLAWANGLKDAFTKNPSEIVPYRILPYAHRAVQKVVDGKIKICTLALS